MASQEDIKLLCKSECIKRYKGLQKLLESFVDKKQPIYLDDIQQLKKDKESYNTIRYSFEELRKEASSEWINVGFIDAGKIICDLCGSSNLKLNFKIKNQINNNEMIIGSSCIEKFPNINSGKISMKKHKDRANKINRSNYINDIYPNIVDMLNAWKGYYSSFPILLNGYLNSDFINLLKDSDKFYNDFIDGKIPHKDVKCFQNYINTFNKLRKEANYFLERNKQNIYVCDTKIENWINKNVIQKDKLIENIRKNDGIIDENISKNIYSIDFIKRFEKNIESEFEIFGFFLESLTQEKGMTIGYKVTRNNIIKLNINLSEFMKKFNFICFETEKVLSKEDIISEFNIYMEENNINNFIDEINSDLEDTIYYVEVNGRYLRFIRNKKNQTYQKYKEKNSQYTEIDIKNFFNIIKKELLNENKYTKKIILNTINKFKNWLDLNSIRYAMYNNK